MHISSSQHVTRSVLFALYSAQASADADPVIKQCPKCGVYIERNQGCAQMLCKSCKHTFCWYCLQNLDVSTSLLFDSRRFSYAAVHIMKQLVFCRGTFS